MPNQEMNKTMIANHLYVHMNEIEEHLLKHTFLYLKNLYQLCMGMAYLKKDQYVSYYNQNLLKQMDILDHFVKENYFDDAAITSFVAGV